MVRKVRVAIGPPVVLPNAVKRKRVEILVVRSKITARQFVISGASARIRRKISDLRDRR